MERLNFEALGRYTTAIEQMQSHLQARSSALFDLKRSLEPMLGSCIGARSVTGFDFEAAEQLLNKAQELDITVRRLVDEANSVAAQCNKPLIVWRM